MGWDLACPDWEARIRAGRSLVPPLPLDDVAADRAVKVFNRLRLADVPGNPRLADAAGDWFRDIVRALFGSWDEATKTRHIREIFALVPKKNSKTSYGAGLMLTALILNQRPKGKFLLVAPTQDVTELAFDQCRGMIDLDAYLTKRFHVQTHLKKITDRTNGATLEVMSFDPNVLTGQKPTGFLVDEVHVVSKSAKAPSAIGQLRGGMIAQPEAFGLFITTQSEQAPVGVFRAELNRARAIRDGRATGPVLPVLYEFPDDIASDQTKWRDPTNWRMVAPNAGRSITVDRLVQEFDTAQQLGAEEVQRWASQHLNIEIGLGLRSDRWAGADLWQSAAEEVSGPEDLLERCDVIVAGLDGGGADDLFALALIGREHETRRWLMWGKCWAHRIVLERRKQLATTLQDFAHTGELTFVDEPGPEVEEAADLIARVDEAGLLGGVGLDPMGIGEVVDALAERGIEGTDRVKGVPQGWKLSAAIKTLERKLANGTFAHAGQPIMAWNVGNAKVEARGNAVAIDKAAAGSAKIDLLAATLNAAVLMSLNPEASGGPSVYETRDMLVI
ncbi:terminase large subunit [Roseomonas gilardii]|nr:terminase large subunit [Roseomonas gilardii]